MDLAVQCFLMLLSSPVFEARASHGCFWALPPHPHPSCLHQARNIMRGMRVGDRVLFYHSSCKVPAVMAVAEVARTAYPDFSAW